MSFLKRLRLETYILILLPLFRLIQLTIINSEVLIESYVGAAKITTFHLLFGGNFLALAFILLYIYLGYKLLMWFVQKILNRDNKPEKASPAIVKQIIYFVFAIGLPTLLIAIESSNLGQTPVEQVIAGSNTLMEWDRLVFGWYTAFTTVVSTMVSNETISKTMIWIYKSLPPMLSVTFITLLIAKKELFRKYLLVFFLSAMVGFLFWYKVPAISPHFMYTHNVFNAEIPENIIQGTQGYNYDPTLEQYVDRVNQNARSTYPLEVGGNKVATYSYTTFPSMHGAWGVMIAYFLFKLWAPFGFIFFPWAVLNAISGVYTKWHYGVDMLLGGAIAIFVIMIVNFLVKNERKRFPKKNNHLIVIDEIQKDAKIFFKKIKSLLTF